MHQYLEYIRNVSIFRNIRYKELEILAALLEKREYPEGENVIQCNDPGNALFIIVEGRAKVILTDEEGNDFLLDELGPGQFFGEISLIDGKARSTDVFSATPLTVLRLKRRDFQDIMHRCPSIMLEMLEVLCHRLRHSIDRLKGVNISQMYIY